MANTRYTVNNVDIDTLFEPIRGSVFGGVTNYTVSGTDLNRSYVAKSLGGLPNFTAITTNYFVNGVDLNKIFQPIGYAPGTQVRVAYTGGSGTFVPSAAIPIGYMIQVVNVICIGGGGGGASGTIFSANGGGGGGGTSIVQYQINGSNQPYQVGNGGGNQPSGPSQRGFPGGSSTFGGLNPVVGGGGSGGTTAGPSGGLGGTGTFQNGGNGQFNNGPPPAQSTPGGIFPTWQGNIGIGTAQGGTGNGAGGAGCSMLNYGFGNGAGGTNGASGIGPGGAGASTSSAGANGAIGMILVFY